jgi:hypothetical protein
VQDEIGRAEKGDVLRDERDRPWAEVLLERPRGVRAHVEGAVHDRPWAGGRDDVKHLDAEKRRHDRVRMIDLESLGDWSGNSLGPGSHPPLHEEPRGMKVAFSHAHRLADRADEGRTEIEFRRKRLDAHAECRNRALHRAVPEDSEVMSPGHEGARGSNERLEVPPSSGRCDDEDLAHGRRQ